jgi:hypothetical protein
MAFSYTLINKFMNPIEDVTQNMTTLSECVTNALESGYVENFKIGINGLLAADGKSIYQPQDIAIANFYRFEGYTNPDDNSILYLVETNDGRKGTLIDAYGVYADAEFSDFIRQVDDIRKKTEN